MKDETEGDKRAEDNVMVTLSDCVLLLFGVATSRNEDVKKLQIFVVENYFLEKYECWNSQSPQGRVINHRRA
eukprot:1676699-Ditylum_brightwellii.AAC.1